MENILSVKGLTKKFGDAYALENVELDIARGEVHGIVGANGSGKSTLLNILSGKKVISDTGGYDGEVIIDGETACIRSVTDAMNLGIGMVCQEFSLISHMNVASNITLTRESIRSAMPFISEEYRPLDERQNHERAKRILASLGTIVDTHSRVERLPASVKQFVEISRELSKTGLRLLMLDEPTASLNKEDAELLMGAINTISQSGTSVIFISHRLDEVVRICDRISVLRDGKVISTYTKKEFDIARIAMDMIGKSVNKAIRRKLAGESESSFRSILSFKRLSLFDGHREFKDINLDIYDGEIIGITSLAGHGQSVFGCGIMGIGLISGKVLLDGMPLDVSNSRSVIRRGIVMLPEERKELGLLINDTVKKNVCFTAMHSKNRFLKRNIIKSMALFDNRAMSDTAKRYISDFNIKCEGADQAVGELSGGNQQKVCLARAAVTDPRVLFVGEPTRGIDIYSKEVILRMLLGMNEEKGTTIVVSSSEIDELRRICDRIVVMYEGRIFGIFPPEVDEETLGLAISGKERQEEAGGRR